jgi:hypothetical protein
MLSEEQDKDASIAFISRILPTDLGMAHDVLKEQSWHCRHLEKSEYSS